MLALPESQEHIDQVAKWVAERTGNNIQKGQYAVAIANSDGTPVLGIIFYGYNGTNVFIDAAFETRMMSMKTFLDAINIAFEEPMNCLRVTTLIDSEEARTRQFVEKIGFKEEGRMLHFVSKNSIAVVYGLVKQ